MFELGLLFVKLMPCLKVYDLPHLGKMPQDHLWLFKTLNLMALSWDSYTGLIGSVIYSQYHNIEN